MRHINDDIKFLGPLSKISLISSLLSQGGVKPA